MKLKTLAMIAVTGMLTTTLVYAAPAANANLDQQNAAVDNVGAVPNTNGNTLSNSGSNGMDLSSNNVVDPLSLDGTTNDDLSADTATGDDDY